MTRYLGFVSILLLGAMLVGCGSDGGSRLYGSASRTYNLDYDRIDIFRQEAGGKFLAMLVQYVYKPGSSSSRIPVKLIVNAPVTVGVDKNLVTEGALTRVMPDGEQFPVMEQGKITFDELGEAGESASGTFFITFEKTGTTLNGDFSGIVQAL